MKIDVAKFANELRIRELSPSRMQVAKWQQWSMVSSFSIDEELFISENVTMGIDKNLQIATMKSLTEFCERKLMSVSLDPIANLTDRSDGFAALPKFYDESHLTVRNNAFHEACERYMWATWWDDCTTEFTSSEFSFTEQSTLKNEFSLENIKLITVIADNHNINLNVFLAKIKNLGFVTGGAAGINGDLNIQTRAFGELLRHLLAFKDMTINPRTLKTFYEQRLHGFGTGKWNNLVEARLNSKGSRKLRLPSLVADKEIIHEHSDFMILHRCLFENQPVFMGGQLERLCI